MLFYRAIFLLSLIGLLVSGYLAYGYALPTPINCPILAGNCQIVRQSIYSSILGIPTPYFGILFYFTIAGISLILMELKNTLLRNFLNLSALVGFLFSLYLTFLEGFVIKAFCFWCLISAAIATIIFALTIANLLKYKAQIINDENRD